MGSEQSSTAGRRAAGFTERPGGFTLIELLVVIGIVGVLVALLLPALAVVRAEGRAVVCLSNIRQASLAIRMYAGQQTKNYAAPLNVSSPMPGKWWSDDERAGQFMAYTAGVRSALACPADEDGGRSYAMNGWASSKIDSNWLSSSPQRGSLWRLTHPKADRLILVIEAWSTTSLSGIEWQAEPIVGIAGLKPGQRFGAGEGVGGLINTKRWGLAKCELPYYRHRSRLGSGARSVSVLAPFGRVVIAYADGHAALKSNDDLAEAETGKSRFDSLWSPVDQLLDR